jgi:HEAT repeat protein
LLQASSQHSLPAGEGELKRLLDPATVRALAVSLSDPDPDVCRAAAELIREAEPATAAPTLAAAIESSSPQTRPALIEALQIALESSPPGAIRDERACLGIARILERPDALPPEERADLVQIYARLAPARSAGEADAVLDAALGDPEAAVRLAAIAELSRRGAPPPGVRNFEMALSGAFRSDDVLLRRTARKEIRANLLASEPDAIWETRLDLLATGLAHRVDREETARSLAEIAHRHAQATERIRDPLLELLSDPDPHVCAAVLGFIGKAGLAGSAGALVDRLDSKDEVVARAAKNALIALGSAAIDSLAAGFRSDDVSFRDLALQILIDLDADSIVLTQIYAAEYRRTCLRAVHRAALTPERGYSDHLLLRYLDERIEEGLNACLCLTGAASGAERVSDLEAKLRSAHDSHQRAILLEAMESLLTPEKRAELVPLYEAADASERGEIAARLLDIVLPSSEQAWSDLPSDSDELVVRLRAQLSPPWLVDEELIADTREMSMETMQITAHLQRAPAFNRLPMRALVRVADSVEEIGLAANEVLFDEGAEDASLYLLVSGEIALSHRGSEICRVGAGSLVGELASVDGGVSVERALAVSPVVALKLHRDPLMMLMADVPDFAIALAQLLAIRVRSLQVGWGDRGRSRPEEGQSAGAHANGERKHG